MKNLRIASDVAFFLAVGSVFLPEDVSIGLMLGFLAAVLVCAVLAGSFENPFLRVVFGLLPAFFAFFATPLRLMILLVGCALYCAVTCALSPGMPLYWNYRRAFLFMGFAALALILFSVFNEIAVGGEGRAVPVFSALFLLLGVLTLRSSRMGEADARWGLMLSAETAAPIALGSGALALVYIIIMNSRAIFEALMLPVAAFLRWLSEVLSGAMNGLFAGREEIVENYSETVETAAESAITEGADPYIYHGAAEDAINRIQIPWLYIGLALVLAALLLILYRYLRLTLAGDGRGGGSVELGAEAFGFARSRKKRREKRTNALIVREAYREYLKYLRREGVGVARSETSGEILEGCPGDGEEQLRELYIRARYGDGRRISAEDARLAEALVSEITEKRA